MRNEVMLSVLVKREHADLWVAHCLEFDIISQGATIDDAFSAVTEAVQLSLEDDYEHHLDCMDRQEAPDEDWEVFHQIMQSRNKREVRTMSPTELARVSVAIGTITVKFAHAADRVAPPESERRSDRVPVEIAPNAPPAWLIASMDQMGVGAPRSRRLC